jgi:hypothetical protein
MSGYAVSRLLLGMTDASGGTCLPRGACGSFGAGSCVRLECAPVILGAGDGSGRSDVRGSLGGGGGRTSCIAGVWATSKLGGSTARDFELFGLVPRGGTFSAWGRLDPAFSPSGGSLVVWSMVTICLEGFAVFLEVRGLVVAWGEAFNGTIRDGHDASLEVEKPVAVWGSSFDDIDRDGFMAPAL